MLLDLLTEEEAATDARCLISTCWRIGCYSRRLAGSGASDTTSEDRLFRGQHRAGQHCKLPPEDRTSGRGVTSGRRTWRTYLPSVTAPTLLIVGGHDEPVIEMNQAAYDLLTCEKKLVIVPGATHLFEEPGTLEQVAKHATQWFRHYLHPRP